ncbi:MAG TPA: peptidoglycan-associated lipoprotein Pal [Kiritimatiellia bacterium]|nr:peptidoglycan-associated lipoprotein Pal [Kiritimatiellia bacterium]
MKSALKMGMLVLMVSAVALTGCKKKPKAGAGGIDGVGGVMGTDLYGDALGLGSRPDDLTMIASQFGVVYFDFDSAQVGPGERTKVEAVAEYLRSNAGVGVIVEGHCDERGSNEYNLALGERRALAVRAYLVNLGIDAGRIQTKSYGEERPVALGHDESSWQQNRRAEFQLFK